MQCYQSFCGNGSPNGQSYTYNPPLPCNGSFPEIIGEGEVTSLVLPDGSVQFFFAPTIKWWSPYTTQPPLNPNNPFRNTPAGIWFVRSIVNPIPPYSPNQQCNTNCGVPFPRPCFSSDCNINIPPPPFHLKFHNDCCTSTTDLYYFYPSLRPTLPTKGSAAVQVQLMDPNPTITHNEQCFTPCSYKGKDTKVNKCACKLSDKCSSMSIDEKELKHVRKTKHCRCPGRGSSATECACKGSNSSTSMHGKTIKNRFKKHRPHASSECCSSSSIASSKKSKNIKSKVVKDKALHSCECQPPPLTTDKSVITYMDQASGSVSEQGRETQTHDCHRTPVAPSIAKFHFTPKCDSDCSSSSCECGNSCYGCV